MIKLIIITQDNKITDMDFDTLKAAVYAENHVKYNLKGYIKSTKMIFDDFEEDRK